MTLLTTASVVLGTDERARRSVRRYCNTVGGDPHRQACDPERATGVLSHAVDEYGTAHLVPAGEHGRIFIVKRTTDRAKGFPRTPYDGDFCTKLIERHKFDVRGPPAVQPQHLGRTGDDDLHRNAPQSFER